MLKLVTYEMNNQNKNCKRCGEELQQNEMTNRQLAAF